MKRISALGSRLVGAGLALAAASIPFGVAGCLDRPVKAIVPTITGVIATQIRVSKVDKIDLLLVVDNSLSMADKQSELGRRMPELIDALTAPDPKTGRPQVTDIHVAVVSSSLGSMGTPICAAGGQFANPNDKGQLLPRTGDSYADISGWKKGPVAATCPTPVAAAPLHWRFDTDTGGSNHFAGTDGAVQLQAATSCLVASAREKGCGYEAILESMYHFLIDPEPYADVDLNCPAGGTVCPDAPNNWAKGVDEQIVAQRAEYLRPDSLLAVLVMADENDVSLQPASNNWIPWMMPAQKMARGWAACESIKDDVDDNAAIASMGCKSCFQANNDPGGNCTKPWDGPSPATNLDVDGRNLRGFGMVQRYGYNFLWPRQRYVDGLSKASVLASSGRMGPNPIFKDGQRTQDLVVFAVITGVPRDLVSDASGVPLDTSKIDWEKVVGVSGSRDPRMIESIKPRTGMPTFKGTIDTSSPLADPDKGGNGGDRDVENGDDLQYACITKRATTTPQSDCKDAASVGKNPLCASGPTQPYFKAYPGLRQIRVARELQSSGFVASICNESFAPAIQGIVSKIQAALNVQCFDANVPVDTDGSAPCLVLEVFKSGDFLDKGCEAIGTGYCTPGNESCRIADGSQAGKAVAFPQQAVEEAVKQINLPISFGVEQPRVLKATLEGGNVILTERDEAGQLTDRKHLVCEMRQLATDRPGVTTETVSQCQSAADLSGINPDQSGWCYATNRDIIGEQCTRQGSNGVIRYVGNVAPKNGSRVFTLCLKALPSATP